MFSFTVHRMACVSFFLILFGLWADTCSASIQGRYVLQRLPQALLVPDLLITVVAQVLILSDLTHANSTRCM